MTIPEKWLLGGAFVLLSLLALTMVCARPPTQDATAIEDTGFWLKAIQAYHPTAVKLRSLAHTHRVQALATADSAQHTVVILSDTSRIGLRIALDSSIRSGILWMRAYHQEALADFADSSRADALQVLLDAGRKPVAAVLKIADCHVLGWSVLPRCLTRTQSFVAGGLVVAALFVLRPQIHL